jgi:Zn-dependent membrane protease YugP
MIFDPLYFLIAAPGMLLALWASYRVKRTFRELSEVGIRSHMSGAEVAHAMLRASGVCGVRVEPHQGFLSDHYDPSEKVVRLSPDVYHGRSVSAVGVAAHECGHVLQDAKDYRFMRIRQSLVGPANFGTSMAYIALAAGLMLKLAGLIWLGVIGFGAVVLFQLVTLPVEFDASARARKHLLQLGIVRQNEDAHVGRVLNAAAWTYVAALISSLL